jgi:hypothetical protein
MSKQSLVGFLEKINDDLTRNHTTSSGKTVPASEIWRSRKGNKLTTTITVNSRKLTKTIKDAVIKASNVSGNGDVLIKELGSEYTNLLNTLMSTVRGNFNTLAQTSGGITFIKGSKSGNIIRVKIEQMEGSRRDNFTTAQKQYTDALQDFYDGFSELVGGYLTRISSRKGRGEIEQKSQGQIFNLEHMRGKSNVQGFINDTIYNAIQSYDGTMQDLQDNAKALGLKTYLNIEKNTKTGEIKVFLGSQQENVAASASEQKIKAQLQKALTKALDKLKDEAFEVKGSDSLKDAKIKKVREKTLKPFKNLKHVKVTSSKSTEVKQPKSSAKLTLNGKVTTVKSGKAALKKRRTARSAKKANIASKPLQLVVKLNKELPATVRKNMQEPGLVNRTGVFSESVRVVDAQKTPKGFPSIGYTYDAEPYGVFEMGRGAPPWATPDRDPRRVIEQSIREVAIELAIGRFYLRRL